MNKLKKIGLVLLCLLAASLAGEFGRDVVDYARAQGFVFGPNGQILGHYIAAGNTPTATGCTIAAGSTDTNGTCTTSATSGSITFATAYATAPTCLIVDASATSTVSMPVYTVSTSAITLTTIISAHVLQWHCAAKSSG